MSDDNSDNITVTAYHAVQAAKNFHNVPRFGHSSNFALVFSQVQEVQQEYYKGVIFIGVLILCFFLVWCMALLVFKCLGPRRFGFLAGAPMFTDPGSDEHGKWWTRRADRVRSVFSLCYVIIVVVTCFLITRGINELQNTTDDLESTNYQFYNIILGFLNITDTLTSLGNQATATRNDTINTINTLCPADPQLDKITNGDHILALSLLAKVALTALGDILHSHLRDVRHSLIIMKKSSEVFAQSMTTFNFNALAVATGVIVLFPATILFVGMVLVWMGRSRVAMQRFMSWGILPLWIIVVVTSVVFSAAASALVLANADFCVGSLSEALGISRNVGPGPDSTIANILALKGVNVTSVEGQALYYYLSQCRDTSPWQLILALRNNLTNTNGTISQVAQFKQELFSVGLSKLESVCQSNFTQLDMMLANLEYILSTLSDEAKKGLQLVSCRKIVPLYVNIVYNASCAYTMESIAWTFSGFLIVAFFGTIMIMLRSSWQDVVIRNATPTDSKNVPLEDDNHPINDNDDNNIVGQEKALSDSEDIYYDEKEVLHEEEVANINYGDEMRREDNAGDAEHPHDNDLMSSAGDGDLGLNNKSDVQLY